MPCEDIAKAHFGLRLKNVREAAGLTVSQLAGRVGQTEESIQQAEDGASDLTAVELWEICAALDVKPSEFFKDST